jgi:hypothetical protein
MARGERSIMRRRQFIAGLGAAGALGQPRENRWQSVYRVDPAYPHHLVNVEGRHLFILNKTAWAYFGCKDPKGVLERARDQGINVIRVALEGQPYFPVLKLDLWPWGGTRKAPDWSKFNAAYWDEVERRTALAKEFGIGLDVVLYFTLKPEMEEAARHRAYWKQAIARLGRHTNVLTWEIANEYLQNESFQDAAGQFLTSSDPQRRPVCTSDGTTDDAAWPHKRWMNLAIVHTCTGSGGDWTLRDWYLRVARNTRSHGKPAFNNETGREQRHKNDDPIHRRKQSWVWCCAGGFWTWHSWEGCEGIDDAGYRMAGGEYLQPLRSYFESMPFWRMDPNETVVTTSTLVASTLCEPGRERVVSYLCTEESGSRISGQHATLRLPSGEYTVAFLRPSDASRVGQLKLNSEGLKKPHRIALPDFDDDLLLDISQTRRGRLAPIPNTQ